MRPRKKQKKNDSDEPILGSSSSSSNVMCRPDGDNNNADVLRDEYEVVIIGAGAAGIGVGAALYCGYMDPSKLCILEQGDRIGASFADWHEHTRFISPSWPSWPFGPQDLNSIVPDTSVNAGSGEAQQHPTGKVYAEYLAKQADDHNLKVHCNQKVVAIDTTTDKFLITLEGRETPIAAICVVWAGGEWCYPKQPKANKQHMVHYKDLVLDEFITEEETKVVVVGLGEAGVDTACALAEAGVSTVVIDGNDPNAPQTKDPSCRLSPKSLENLDRYRNQIQILRGQKCVAVTEHKSSNNCWKLEVELAPVSTSKDQNKTTLRTTSRVIDCSGFEVPKNNPILRDLFDWRPDGFPVLKPSCDESTQTPNLFLVGPMVRHDVSEVCGIDDGPDGDDDEEGSSEEEKEEQEGKQEGDDDDNKNDDDNKELEENENNQANCQTAVFCFVYKYRTRFPVVAEEVIYRVINECYREEKTGSISREGQMWGTSMESMRKHYESKGMYLAEPTAACATCD